MHTRNISSAPLSYFFNPTTHFSLSYSFFWRRKKITNIRCVGKKRRKRIYLSWTIFFFFCIVIAKQGKACELKKNILRVAMFSCVWKKSVCLYHLFFASLSLSRQKYYATSSPPLHLILNSTLLTSSSVGSHWIKSISHYHVSCFVVVWSSPDEKAAGAETCSTKTYKHTNSSLKKEDQVITKNK